MINKNNVFVSPLLTKTSLAYRNDNYISELIMPIINVQKDTAQIATYGMDNLRVVEAIRAQGSKANEVNHTVSIGEHYILQDHALKEMVTKEEEDNADMPITPRIDATENLTDRMWVIKEKKLADIMGDTSIITKNTTLSGTSQWTDKDNSDPINDIKVAIESVRTNSGKNPNTFIMGHVTMLTLLEHPEMIARIITTANKTVSPDLVMEALKRLFPWITNILVWNAQFNSGVEGGTDVLSDIWVDNFQVAYIESKPRLKSRSFGFTYQKKGENRKVKVLTFDEDAMGRFIRVNDKYDQKIVDVTCMYLIKDTNA